jgi:hypothetical protein
LFQIAIWKNNLFKIAHYLNDELLQSKQYFDLFNETQAPVHPDESG